MNKLPFELKERKIIIKNESPTDNSYGKYPKERSTKELLNNGVICLNKVDGPTSHQVADYVKKILKLEKVGHGGTLDPNVSGVLPIGLGKATRLMEALLKGGKEYVCLMHIHSEINEDIIRKSSERFIGKIIQLPPVKSAVKRQLREREIYYIEILEIKGQDILFKVGCQAGTYIRRLCDDFGKYLGTKAHMQELVRTKACNFTDSEWYSLHDVMDAFYLYKEENNDSELRKIIKPSEFAVSHLPKLWVIDSAVDTLCHGANLSIPGISKFESCIEKNDLVAVFSLKEELISLGTAVMSSEDIKSNERGIAIKSKKVFMEPEVYPHYKKSD